MKEEKKESPIGVLWGWGKLYHLSLIHISEPTRRTPISYAVFCLKKKKSEKKKKEQIKKKKQSIFTEA